MEPLNLEYAPDLVNTGHFSEEIPVFRGIPWVIPTFFSLSSSNILSLSLSILPVH